MKLAAGFKPPKRALAIATVLIVFGAGSYLLGWSSLLTVKQINSHWFNFTYLRRFFLFLT